MAMRMSVAISCTLGSGCDLASFSSRGSSSCVASLSAALICKGRNSTLSSSHSPLFNKSNQLRKMHELSVKSTTPYLLSQTFLSNSVDKVGVLIVKYGEMLKH